MPRLGKKLSCRSVTGTRPQARANLGTANMMERVVVFKGKSAKSALISYGADLLSNRSKPHPSTDNLRPKNDERWRRLGDSQAACRLS